MTTKQELLTKISDFEAILNTLKSQVKELETSEPEEMTGIIYDEPENRKMVWTVDIDGTPFDFSYGHSQLDIMTQGNIFHDKESAELEAKRRAIKHRLAKFCRDAWAYIDEPLDWNDGCQNKSRLRWDHLNKEPDLNAICVCIQEGDFYLPSGYNLLSVEKQFTNAELKLALAGSE